jgi:uncharacterized membrane protein HdeD (DUF308 family)
MNDTSPGWKRGVLVGLGVLAIIFSILVFIHPGMTVVTLVYIMGITLIIVGLEKIISGIFERHGSKWGTVGLGVLALIFGSLAMVFPISTGVFVIVVLGVGLLFVGISHLVYGFGNKGSPAWQRGFSIGAGALAVILSFLVMGSPYAGAVAVSVFVGIALLIIGIEIVVVGVSGRRMPMMPSDIRR